MFTRKTSTPPATPATRPMDVPAGPGTRPEIDAGIARSDAEHTGYQDAPAYDTDSVGVDQPMPYPREIEHSTEQSIQDSLDVEIRQQQVNDAIIADRAAELTDAQTHLADGEDRARKAVAHRDEIRRKLTTPDGVWYDPDRVDEPRWKTILNVVGFAVAIGVLETALTYTVMLSFGFPEAETLLLALGFTVMGVGIPAMAGAVARRHRGQTTRSARLARWGLPVAGMVMLFVVQAMLATLRTGFLAAPQIDPSTGAELPSTLTGVGIPPALLMAGWWAVQVGLSIWVAVHAEHNHNPFVWAHRRATGKAAAAIKALAAARAAAERARLAYEDACTNRTRLAEQFRAHRDWLRSLAAQLVEIYGRAMIRAKSDPAFTSAMEQRLARYAEQRQSRDFPDTPPILSRVS